MPSRRPDKTSASKPPPEPSPKPQAAAPSPPEYPDLESLSSEDLMHLCQEGDEQAFEMLLERFQGPALSFIGRMIGDQSRVEALGQEAFLRIFKDGKSYEYPRSFTTWFYTIVRNLCKNELRWRSRHPTISLDEPLSGSGRKDPEAARLGDHLTRAAEEPIDKLLSEELLGKMDELLNSLPYQDRELIVLKWYQGKKYRDIAELVGLPVGTVRGRVHAVLERLRKSAREYL